MKKISNAFFIIILFFLLIGSTYATTRITDVSVNSSSFFGAFNLLEDMDIGGYRIYNSTLIQSTKLGIADSLATAQSNAPSGYSVYVQDDVRVGGNILGSGADVAERFYVFVNETLKPGDVVISKGKNMTIGKSEKAYDKRVIGVVSTKPSYILADERKGIPVAMIGTVPVKVIAENNSIETGDLLVASSIPGYAMKCNNETRCEGAIIGKALESMKSGTGVISMIVMLA